MAIDDDTETVLWSEDQISQRVSELAAEIGAEIYHKIDTMKRANPWNDQVDLVSSDDSDTDVKPSRSPKLEAAMKLADDIEKDARAVEKFWEDDIARRAAIYQDHMNQIPIPTMRGSIIPFNSWVELGNSIKALCEQPLHYLTNVHLNEWDKARLDTDDEDQPLDLIIHPAKAEATVWFMEEIHRRTTSYAHLANLWRQEKMYSAFIDPAFPPKSSPPCKLEPM